MLQNVVCLSMVKVVLYEHVLTCCKYSTVVFRIAPKITAICQFENIYRFLKELSAIFSQTSISLNI